MTRSKHKPLLQIKVEGPGVRAGSINVPDLVKILEHAQGAINRKAEATEGRRTLRPGPITSVVRSECALEFVGIGKGSVTLSFDLAKPQTPLPLPEVKTFGEEVIEGIVSDIKCLGRASKAAKTGLFDPGVLDSLSNLGEIFERRTITRLEWIVPKRQGKKAIKAVFNPTVRKRVLARIQAPRQETATLEGILEMADFKETDKKCRVHPTIGSPVICAFDVDKEDQVYALLRNPVSVEGEATLDPHTGRVELIHIKKLSPLEPLSLGASFFFSGKTIDELATMQGVKPLENLSVLAGGLPEDPQFDELMEEIYRDRE